jgi:glycosyltransferase
MRISVITVVRNAAATIGDALDSVAAQTHPDVEHLVIDGASTDGTVEIVRARGSRVATFVSEPDTGLYDAMNKGLQRATGDVVGYLNADDVFAHRDVLATIATTFEGAAADAVWGDLLYVRPDDLDRVVRWWRSEPYRPGLLARGWMPPHPTLYVRRERLVALGGFDTRWRWHADFDLVVRLFGDPGLRGVHVPDVFVRMRTGGHTNRSLGNVWRGNRESRAIVAAHGVGNGITLALGKLAHRVPQFFRRPPR